MPAFDLLALGPIIDDRNNQPNPTATYADLYQISQNPEFGWFAPASDTDANPTGAFDYDAQGAWLFTLTAIEGGVETSVSICIHTPAADCLPPAPAEVIVVDEDNPNWGFADESSPSPGSVTSEFVLGPDVPPEGMGSARLALGGTTDGVLIGTQNHAGTRLDDIELLRYWSYQDITPQAIALQLNVDYDDTDATTSWQGRLVFEPINGGVPPVLIDTWQEWDALAGMWWSSGTPIVGGSAVEPDCPISSPCDWATLLSLYPNLAIHELPLAGVLFKAGSGWPAGGFDGNVDAFRLKTSTVDILYDFDVSDGGSSCQSVIVDNPSFEDLVLSDGAWAASIPGWSFTVLGGTYNPGTAQFPGGVPDGVNSVFANSGGSIIQTITSEIVVSDAEYLLEVDVGDRVGVAAPSWTAELAVDGTVRASVDQTSVAPADGTLETAVASFIAGAADAGGSLEIRLLSTDSQSHFDDVRLCRINDPGDPGDTGILGVAKQMTASGSALPLTVTLEFVFENFSATEPLADLSAIDNLFAVFGLPVVDWTFTSISSVPAAFANDTFDGAADFQLINQAPKQGLAPGATATVTVTIELLTFAGDTDMNGQLCNQIFGAGVTTGGEVVIDLSTAGLDPDPGGDGAPEEALPSCISTLAQLCVDIPADNFSFEDQVVVDGGWTSLMPGWTQVGVNGTFNPTAAQFPGGVPDGDNSAYLNSGSIRQVIAAETLLAGNVYQLEVDVGDRAGVAAPNWTAELAVNGTVRASVDQTTVTPADGAFATAQASFATTAADAGLPLEIRLAQTASQVNFDTARLCRYVNTNTFAPTVAITSPTDGTTVTQGDSVSFTGTATDVEDGDLSASLAWSSDLDGGIGSGAAFSSAGLSLGTHTITAMVTDSGGLPGSSTISLTVDPPPVQNPLNVTNPSFEIPALPADGAWQAAGTPGWTVTGFTGTWNPGVAQFPAEAPDGDSVAFANSGTLAQTLAESATNGETYTLKVEVGHRLGVPFPGYEVRLLIGGVVVASDVSTLNPAPGAFATTTVAHTATAGDDGGALAIELVSLGTQTAFDDVELFSTP